MRRTWTAGRARASAAMLGALAILAAAPAQVAAATVTPDQPAAFFVGASGGLETYGRAADGSWSDAIQLGSSGLAPANAAVAATPIQDGTIAAFFIGSNGAVYLSCPSQPQPWPVTASGVGEPGGSLDAALAGGTVLVVFAAPGNTLYMTRLISNPCVPPHPRVSVTSVPNAASWASGGQLAAAGLSDGEFGVFYFDSTGTGRALWQSAAGTWTDSVILPAGTASPGGSITVTPGSGASTAPGALSLFYTGQDGRIYRAQPLAGGGLAAAPQPDPSTSAATVPGNARLAASSSAAETTVSFVADNGAVTLLPVNAQGQWQSTVPVSGPGFAALGSSLASTATATEVDIYGGTYSGSPGHIAYTPQTDGPGTWLPAGPAGMTAASTAFAAAG